MDARHFLAMTLLLLTTVVACNRSRPTPVVQPPQPPVVAEEPATAVAEDAADPVAAETPEDVASEEPDPEEIDERFVVGEPVDPQPPGPTSPRERFLLLTRDGPLVIDLELTIDGRPFSYAMDDLVDRAMVDGDTDGDGDATWEEILDSPKFVYGQFGNLTAEQDSDRPRLIEMYDNNRDGIANWEELPRFLTRNAGGAQSFSLRSSNEYRGDNRTRSPLREVLDVDRDGAITADEMEQAPARLAFRDADDDEILVATDFRESIDPREQQMRTMSNRRRSSAPDTALIIAERPNWRYIAYELSEQYAFGELITADDVPMTPKLFEQLDTDGDGRWKQNELEGLTTVPPHLVLGIEFGTTAEGESGPRLSVLTVAEDLKPYFDAARVFTTRIAVDLPGAELELFVNDDPSLGNVEQVAEAQLSALDADNNSYLDEDEFPGQFLGVTVPFAAIDPDGDGKAYVADVAALIEQRQSVIRSQVRARAADNQDAWFTAIDTTGDGRLTARELYAAPDVLKALDENGDGLVQSHEVPGSISVGFVRGDPQRQDLFQVTAEAPATDEGDAPKWFTGMDANGDGEISSREFVGSAAKFAKLDANEDGFLSRAELPVPETATTQADSESAAETADSGS